MLVHTHTPCIEIWLCTVVDPFVVNTLYGKFAHFPILRCKENRFRSTANNFGIDEYMSNEHFIINEIAASMFFGVCGCVYVFTLYLSMVFCNLTDRRQPVFCEHKISLKLFRCVWPHYFAFFLFCMFMHCAGGFAYIKYRRE